MGEYYKWINIDKHEYICPADFDYGNKYTETVHRDSEPTLALYTLLSDRWKGDHILWFGDECPLTGEEKYEIIRTLYKQSADYGYPGDAEGMIFETYTNISGLFSEAEKYVRPEIESFVEDQKNHTGYNDVNEYGIDIEHPFDGLFMEKGRRFRYTINHTKKIGYSLEETKILYLNRRECDFADPLPILLGFGRMGDPGLWVGDVIGVADKMPDGYTLMEEVMLNWGE